MGLRLRSVIAAAVIAAAASPAMGTLVDTDGGYAGPFIDLSSRIGLGPLDSDAAYGFTFGPVVLPGMVFTRSGIPPADTNSGLGAVLGQGKYQLGKLDPPGQPNNGAFGAGAVYAGLDGAAGYMQFLLTGDIGVSEFGAYVNYSPGSGLPDVNDPFNGAPYIAALGRDGNVLESFNLATDAPVNTPGAFNEFAFRGISLTSPDIFGLRLGNAYILAAGSADGSVPTGGPAPIPAVPEPQTYALMLAGLGAVAFMSRRRRTKRT